MLVRFLGLRGGGHASGPDGPHRLVGDDEIGHLLGGESVEAILDLPIEDGERVVALALFERFADAHNRRQVGGEGRAHLLIHRRVGVAEEAPPLGVPDDRVFGAGVLDHGAPTPRR